MGIIIFLVAVGILVFLEMELYHRKGLDDLDISVRFSQEVANFGDTIDVIEVAQNKKRLPLPFLILKFETPVAIQFNDMSNVSLSDNYYREDMLSMGSFSKHTRIIKVTCAKRGFYTFTRVTASSSDMLLLEKMGVTVEANSSITILPEILASDLLDSLMSVTFSETTARRTLLTDPFSFAGIREYQPWDPMRSINWTASAKTGDFMVNQNISTSDRRVNIFLNFEKYNLKKQISLLEKTISIAYTYILALCEQGISVSLFTNGKDVVTNSLVCDFSNETKSSFQRGLELARIDLQKEIVPFFDMFNEHVKASNGNDLNVIISANCDNKFRSSISNVISEGRNILWVLPCYDSDPMASNMAVENDIAPHFMKFEVRGHD